MEIPKWISVFMDVLTMSYGPYGMWYKDIEKYLFIHGCNSHCIVFVDFFACIGHPLGKYFIWTVPF